MCIVEFLSEKIKSVNTIPQLCVVVCAYIIFGFASCAIIIFGLWLCS